MTRHPDVAFDEVWKRIHALEGTTVPLAARGEIEILKVDERAVVRRTSRGNIGSCPSTPFAGRWMR